MRGFLLCIPQFFFYKQLIINYLYKKSEILNFSKFKQKKCRLRESAQAAYHEIIMVSMVIDRFCE
jgi:hypothetical protein